MIASSALALSIGLVLGLSGREAVRRLRRETRGQDVAQAAITAAALERETMIQQTQSRVTVLTEGLGEAIRELARSQESMSKAFVHRFNEQGKRNEELTRQLDAQGELVEGLRRQLERSEELLSDRVMELRGELEQATSGDALGRVALQLGELRTQVEGVVAKSDAGAPLQAQIAGLTEVADTAKVVAESALKAQAEDRGRIETIIRNLEELDAFLQENVPQLVTQAALEQRLAALVQSTAPAVAPAAPGANQALITAALLQGRR